MKLSKMLSPLEAANQLGMEYHTFLSWIKKDECGVLKKGLATKFNWGWIIDKKVVTLFKEKLEEEKQ